MSNAAERRALKKKKKDTDMQLSSYEAYTRNSQKYNKEAEPYVLVWSAQNAKEKLENLLVIRTSFLAPFLYGEQTFCDEALSAAKSGSLLPPSGLWAPFFDRGSLGKLESFTMVLEYALRALEADPFYIPFTLSDYGMGQLEAEASCIGYFQYLCPDFKDLIPIKELRLYVRVVRLQLRHVITTMRSKGVRYVIEEWAEKCRQNCEVMEAIKEQGNKHTKDLQYRAAIADYTRAIRMNPYNEFLYCNRAMCYLKCQDYWLATVDSMRAYSLKADYEKAYFRCTEAWLHLGELRFAAILNQVARKVCRFCLDLDKQWREIKEIWDKAKKGVRDPTYCCGYKQSDVDRGFPEVYPFCEVQCAECLNQSQRMGLVYDGLPRVTIFRSALSPHVPPMTDWFGSRGPPPNFPGQKNRSIAAIEDAKDKMSKKAKGHSEAMTKVEVTFGHPMDPMAIQRVFKTLQKLDHAEKTGEKYDPHCFEEVSPPRRSNYDIPLPDGRKMYFEPIQPNGYMAVRIERPVEGGRK